MANLWLNNLPSALNAESSCKARLSNIVGLSRRREEHASLVSQSHNRIDPRGSPRRNTTRCQRYCREQYWNRRERKRI